MSNLTPQQIDRGLGIAEAVVGLVTDVWKHRQQRPHGKRLAGGVARKLATAHRKATKAKSRPRRIKGATALQFPAE